MQNIGVLGQRPTFYDKAVNQFIEKIRKTPISEMPLTEHSYLRACVYHDQATMNIVEIVQEQRKQLENCMLININNPKSFEKITGKKMLPNSVYLYNPENDSIYVIATKKNKKDRMGLVTIIPMGGRFKNHEYYCTNLEDILNSTPKVQTPKGQFVDLQA